jgi:PAT family beta-lactamase induction signal transducer AmpG
LLKSFSAFFQVLQNRKMLALLLLGFSSGLPLFLTSRTLQAWMTLERVDLSVIGLFSLVALPYSLKFLWAPVLDLLVPPFLGRRRGWILLSQVALCLAIIAMAWQNPQTSLGLLAFNALIIAFFSATQDIAVDAYRTDVLSDWEAGAGAAVSVLGYRIALIITGSVALILAQHLPWSMVYLSMAGLMGVCILFSYFAPEPSQPVNPPNSLREAVILPFVDFVQRLGLKKSLLSLLFIVLYKLGDALVNNMVTPFLVQTGFRLEAIGVIQGGMGLAATIVGALLGGVLLSRWGINRSLWIFGALQALSNLVYFVLSLLGNNYPFMVLAINVENFCAGLGTAAFLAFLMSLCQQRYSATQFALLSSLMALSRDIVVAPAGKIAEATGWPEFFLLTLVLALPGLLLLPFFAPWGTQDKLVE